MGRGSRKVMCDTICVVWRAFKHVHVTCCDATGTAKKSTQRGHRRTLPDVRRLGPPWRGAREVPTRFQYRGRRGRRARDEEGAGLKKLQTIKILKIASASGKLVPGPNVSHLDFRPKNPARIGGYQKKSFMLRFHTIGHPFQIFATTPVVISHT